MQDRDLVFDTIPGIFKAKFPRLTGRMQDFLWVMIIYLFAKSSSLRGGGRGGGRG